MSDLAVAASALGAGFAAVKPLAETASKFAEALLGEPLQVAGGMLADHMYAWQTTNRIKILHKAKRRFDESGADPSIVPPGFLVPAIEACGNCESEDLQSLWAELLLAAVCDHENAQTMYVDTLRRLSPSDAAALRCLPRANRCGVERPQPIRAPNEQIGQQQIARLLALSLVEVLPPPLEVEPERPSWIDSVQPGFRRSQKVRRAPSYGQFIRLTPYGCQFLIVVDAKSTFQE